jgi:hypothetical protein
MEEWEVRKESVGILKLRGILETLKGYMRGDASKAKLL